MNKDYFRLIIPFAFILLGSCVSNNSLIILNTKKINIYDYRLTVKNNTNDTLFLLNKFNNGLNEFIEIERKPVSNFLLYVFNKRDTTILYPHYDKNLYPDYKKIMLLPKMENVIEINLKCYFDLDILKKISNEEKVEMKLNICYMSDFQYYVLSRVYRIKL